MDVEHCHVPVWTSPSTVQFLSKVHCTWENVSHVVWLSVFEAIQLEHCVIASISIVKLDVVILWAALSSWMVVAPCWK